MLSKFENGFSCGATPGRPALSRLSEQERRILALLAAGKTPAEIADRLFLSARAIEWSLAKIDRKVRPSVREASPAPVESGSRRPTNDGGNRP
jgi:DNA-binding NarL/FixJ family response regulator